MKRSPVRVPGEGLPGAWSVGGIIQHQLLEHVTQSGGEGRQQGGDVQVLVVWVELCAGGEVVAVGVVPDGAQQVKHHATHRKGICLGVNLVKGHLNKKIH